MPAACCVMCAVCCVPRSWLLVGGPGLSRESKTLQPGSFVFFNQGTGLWHQVVELGSVSISELGRNDGDASANRMSQQAMAWGGGRGDSCGCGALTATEMHGWVGTWMGAMSCDAACIVSLCHTWCTLS